MKTTMNNIRYAVLAVMALLLVACASDEATTSRDAGETITVNYRVQLPEEVATRAYADGTTAQYLTYGLYFKTDDGYVLEKSSLRKEQFEDLVATLSLDLVRGQEYFLFFWADNNKGYTFDFNAITVTMDYANAVSREGVTLEGNNDARDAFYNTLELSTDVTNSIVHDDVIYLYRPFAQVNVGASDLAILDDCEIDAATLTFTQTFPAGLPTVLDLVTGETSEPTSYSITFESVGVPSGETFPVEGYDYLTMNYVLCDSEIVIFDDAVTLTIANLGDDNEDISASFYDVPVCRNYRTNIYGTFFTFGVIVDFDLVIDPLFTGSLLESEVQD